MLDPTTQKNPRGLALDRLRLRQGEFQLRADSLVFARGHVHGILGASGAGKSTLLTALAGLTPCEEFRARFDGASFAALGPEHRRMAWVPQRPSLMSFWSVRENAELPLRLQKKPRSGSLAWLRAVGAEAWADRPASELSVGQAQRVALARALAAEFPILLLDEPFSALDADSRGNLRTLVKEYVRARDVCALFVSHAADDAADCDRRWRIADGEIREDKA